MDALLQRLRKEVLMLDDNRQEPILESAFRAACAEAEIGVENDQAGVTASDARVDRPLPRHGVFATVLN